jgi:hypothetical protein
MWEDIAILMADLPGYTILTAYIGHAVKIR